MAEVNPLSNLSYTNKDFQDIYPELLNLSKKISYKWDPTVSNESDPGVILLKLCAIIADKNNYNIDKNVLENFPLSVTQETNARQLFDQLGYRMQWYRSATTTVAMRWIGNIEADTPDTYPIDIFTMIADSTNENVYTLIEPVSISQNGTTVEVPAIQGIATKFTVNGEERITPDLLDSHNRIYFVDRNVAENGIFIKNADNTMGTESDGIYYGGWKQVDNLATEPLGKSIYKFGVTRDGRTCYIEFPDDADAIMGQGINITYIKTDGRYGNISSKILSKFYNDVSVISEFNEELILNSDNVQLTNTSSTLNGSDPETIDSAYRNYQKTIGTFNTLVTCRDYTNAINNAGFISNGFVCDRTNDVQCSYNIMSYDGDLTKRILSVEKEDSPIGEKPSMDAFDLKVYVLQYVDDPSTNAKSYNSSFNVLVNNENKTDESIINTLDYINDVKSIQHDFMPLLNNRLCMIKNKYPIDCKIIPQQKITATQELSIISNILKSLYGTFNSKRINFGEEISYDLVYNTILNADERIKSVMLDVLDYSTYAVYTDGNFFKEVNINTFEDEVCGYYNSNDGLFYYDTDFTQQIPFIVWQEDKEYVAQGQMLLGTGVTPPSTATWSNFIHYYNITDHKSWTPVLSEKVFTDISTNGENSDKTFKCGISSFIEDIVPQIQNDIYAKSVLNGNTQLLTPDSSFNYALTQKCRDIVNDVEYISTNTDVEFNDGTNSPTYLIKNNEHIYLYAPSLIDTTTYSKDVKFQFQIYNDIASNSDYQLGENESIAFYWKSSEDDSIYKYYKYGQGTIIRPLFKMTVSESASNDNYIGRYLGYGTGDVPDITVEISGKNYTLNQHIKQMTSSQNLLSSTKTISIRKVNEITLTSSTPCFWITNRVVENECYLFYEGQTTYILQPGEYFFYSAIDSSNATILGAGTELTRSSGDGEWKVNVVNYSEMIEYGADAFQNVWKIIPDNEVLAVKEMQFMSFNSGTTFKISLNNGNPVNLLFDNTGVYTTPYEWVQDAEYSPIGVELTESGVTPITEGDVPKPSSPHYYNSTDSISWTSTPNENAGYTVQVDNLNDYTMSYDDGTGTETVIPQVIIGDIGWSGKTFLSFNVSNSVPQILDTNQTIKYRTVNQTEYSVIHDDSSKLYILTDATYAIDGGENINVTRLSLSGNVHYMKLYVYFSTKDTESGNFTYSDDGSIYIKIEASDDNNDGNISWIALPKVDNEEKYNYISQLYIWKDDDNYSATGVEIVGSGVSPITLAIPPESTSQHYYNPTDHKSWTATTKATQYTDSGQTPQSMSLAPTVGALAFNSVDEVAWEALSTVTRNIQFLLPSGEYIVPLFLSENFEEVIATLVIVKTDQSTIEKALYTINSTDISLPDLSQKGIYYIKMDLAELYDTSSDIDHFEIRIDVTILEGVHKVTILPILKYFLPIMGYTDTGEPVYMSKGSYEAVLHRLINLDTENQFDYTYIVDEDELILNPLDAKSFFDSNHILNKCTIAQLDTATNKIYITNKLK